MAAVIGFALGYAALDTASGTCCGTTGDLKWWGIALVTVFATIMFSVYLRGRGFIGMLPILLGAITGYVVAIPMGLVDFSVITAASVITAPHITMPSFGYALSATAMISISIMAIATIPESTAHLYQISLYVDNLAEQLKCGKYGLSEYVGMNLVLDGLGDIANGLFGGVANTNDGENNSLMVITRNYAVPALIAAGVIAIILSFSGTLVGIINSVPTSVCGGLAIYLFGVIGMQGIALMISEKVDLFDPRNLAVGAIIMVVGIGGHVGYPGGLLPILLLTNIFPNGWPAIATAAVAGILLDLVFVIFKPKSEKSQSSQLELR